MLHGSEDAMNKLPYFAIDYYDRQVIQSIMDKYGLDAMDATRQFICSETHSLLEDAANSMWSFPAYAIFDMWEAEKVTGDPRNSLFIRSE